jgi:hypothetical protein
MEKDNFELATEPEAETGHCENTAQTTTERTPAPSGKLHGGYDVCRLNALRHGVLSAHTVLPWEDKAEYEALLNALVKEYAPHGPTEEHLVEEVAGVIWRKRRLRLAEAASYRRGLEGMRQPFSDPLQTALIQVEPIIDFFTQSPWRTPEDLPELKKRQASARKALEILSTGKSGAYDAAVFELDESTRQSWEEQIAPEPEDLDEDEDPEGDEEPFTADPTALAQYLKDSVLPQLAKHLGFIENRHLIREHVLGEAVECTKLESLSRYEVHLDRKLERMLTMLLRLQSLRRSKESD